MSFVQAVDYERAKRSGKLAVAPNALEVFEDFAGFDEEERLSELYGYSWMSRRERERQIEILTEFEEAGRLAKRDVLTPELWAIIHATCAGDAAAQARRRDSYHQHKWKHAEQFAARHAEEREARASRRAAVFASSQPPCMQCGAVITEPPTRGSMVRRYCSRKCRGLAWYHRNKHKPEAAL